MFGFGAGSQDKLPLPAGPNHCLLKARLACLPQPETWPLPRPVLPCLPREWALSGHGFCYLGEALRSLDVLSQRLALGCMPAYSVTGSLAQVGVEGWSPAASGGG